MVDFCPECGSILRKQQCKCGYGQKQPIVAKNPEGIPIKHGSQKKGDWNGFPENIRL